MLKTMCLLDKAMSLIINSTIIKHALKTDAIDACSLNGFHYLINCANLIEVVFLDFATHHRENVAHEKLSSSLMHDLHLGKIHNVFTQWQLLTNIEHRNIQIINIVLLKLSKHLNVHSVATEDISLTLFDLCNSGIDFYL